MNKIISARLEMFKLMGLASVVFFIGVVVGGASGKWLSWILMGAMGTQVATCLIWALLEYLAQRRGLDEYAPPRRIGSQ
jgi:hypothetical protein